MSAPIFTHPMCKNGGGGIVDYLRGQEAVVRWLDDLSGEAVSSYVCLAELYEGVWRVKRRQHADQAVRTFFASLNHVYGLNGDIAQSFGKLRAELKGRGKVIEDMDLLIAATCQVYDLTLLTRSEKHFRQVPKLRIETP